MLNAVQALRLPLEGGLDLVEACHKGAVTDAGDTRGAVLQPLARRRMAIRAPHMFFTTYVLIVIKKP